MAVVVVAGHGRGGAMGGEAVEAHEAGSGWEEGGHLGEAVLAKPEPQTKFRIRRMKAITLYTYYYK